MRRGGAARLVCHREGGSKCVSCDSDVAVLLLCHSKQERQKKLSRKDLQNHSNQAMTVADLGILKEGFQLRAIMESH